jgi:hypothetical protein
VSPVRYELGFYIPEDDILLSDRRETLKPSVNSYTDCAIPAPYYKHQRDYVEQNDGEVRGTGLIQT